jgi:hypothetical protein
MTTGEAAAGLALVLRLMAMSGWVMQTVRGIFENVGVIQESMQTISRPHGIVDRPDARTLAVGGGDIRFDRVGFRYGDGTPAVIEDFNLHIRPGEKVGLVGVSGAGKTTLTALLLRLHDIQSGRILIDGQDIAGVTQESLRGAIAPRIPRSCIARSGTTSPMAGRTRRWRKSCGRRNWPKPMRSSPASWTTRAAPATTPRWASAASSSPAASASASPSPASSSRTRRS